MLHSHLSVVVKQIFPLQTPASVMELVDVPDSKSGAARRGGSSPPRGTTDLSLAMLRWHITLFPNWYDEIPANARYLDNRLDPTEI